MSGHMVVATLSCDQQRACIERVISFYATESRFALFQDMATAIPPSFRSAWCARARAARAVRRSADERGHVHDLIARGDVQAIKESMEQSLIPRAARSSRACTSCCQKDTITREDALTAADSRTTCCG